MLWTDPSKTKLVPLAVAVAVLLVAYVSASAKSMAEIQYQSWDGKNWVARYSGSRFIHSPEGTKREYEDTVIRYLSWDGQRLAARLNKENFLIAPDGDFGSSRTARLDYIRYRDWNGRTKTAQWRPQYGRIEVNRPAGVMIVASTGLHRFTDLKSHHNICISSQSQVALEEYVKEFNLRAPRYRKLPAAEYWAALERGICHAAMVFATRDAVSEFASRFERSSSFRIVEVP
jgi:hypothetical protein